MKVRFLLLRITQSIAWQVALVAAVVLLPAVPPAAGPMLILPLRQVSPGATVAWATEAGARLIGSGPYEGSLFVQGERSRLLGPAFRAGALIIAGSGAACNSKGVTPWNA